jgi:hypothetical protein
MQRTTCVPLPALPSPDGAGSSCSDGRRAVAIAAWRMAVWVYGHSGFTTSGEVVCGSAWPMAWLAARPRSGGCERHFQISTEARSLSFMPRRFGVKMRSESNSNGVLLVGTVELTGRGWTRHLQNSTQLLGSHLGRLQVVSSSPPGLSKSIGSQAKGVSRARCRRDVAGRLRWAMAGSVCVQVSRRHSGCRPSIVARMGRGGAVIGLDRHDRKCQQVPGHSGSQIYAQRIHGKSGTDPCEPQDGVLQSGCTGYGQRLQRSATGTTRAERSTPGRDHSTNYRGNQVWTTTRFDSHGTVSLGGRGRECSTKSSAPSTDSRSWFR